MMTACANNKVALFLWKSLQATVASVKIGHSHQATLTVTGAGHPLHVIVQRTQNGDLIARSNDVDLFSGQAPSLHLTMQKHRNISTFVRELFQVLAPQVVHDYVEARVSFDRSPNTSISPIVWVGNSNFGTLGPKRDSYTL
jgi:hypothetical protein